jgi:hypothetical protein
LDGGRRIAFEVRRLERRAAAAAYISKIARVTPEPTPE